MRRFLLCGTAALALSSAPVLAGGLVEPAMEPEVVATATKGSSAGILIPVLILVLVAAAVASSGGDGRRGMQASDRRVKTDCTWVGMTADAIPVWRYRYIGAPQIYEGVMAQDVAMRRPDAAVIWPNGLMAVDYDRLGISLRLVA